MFHHNPRADVEYELDRLTDWAEGLGVDVEILHDEGRSIYIASLGRNRADKSTKGNGRRVVNAIIAMADHLRIPTEVSFMSDEPAVGQYYETFGFTVDLGQTPHLITNMTRLPAA